MGRERGGLVGGIMSHDDDDDDFVIVIFGVYYCNA